MANAEVQDYNRFHELMEETQRLGSELEALKEKARESEKALKVTLRNKNSAFTEWARAQDEEAEYQEIDFAERVYREALLEYESAGILDFSAQKKVRQMEAKLAPLNREATELGIKLEIFYRFDPD
jgi:seryl-tRNA synthetase